MDKGRRTNSFLKRIFHRDKKDEIQRSETKPEIPPVQLSASLMRYPDDVPKIKLQESVSAAEYSQHSPESSHEYKDVLIENSSSVQMKSLKLDAIRNENPEKTDTGIFGRENSMSAPTKPSSKSPKHTERRQISAEKSSRSRAHTPISQSRLKKYCFDTNAHFEEVCSLLESVLTYLNLISPAVS
jgi:hypothetical protein